MTSYIINNDILKVLSNTLFSVNEILSKSVDKGIYHTPANRDVFYYKKYLHDYIDIYIQTMNVIDILSYTYSSI